MTFLDCKDKKRKSKKQILRFKIWQDELKEIVFIPQAIILSAKSRQR